MLATITARPTTVRTIGIADLRAASLKSTAASLAWSSARDARSSTNSATPSIPAEPEPGTPAVRDRSRTLDQPSQDDSYAKRDTQAFTGSLTT